MAMTDPNATSSTTTATTTPDDLRRLRLFGVGPFDDLAPVSDLDARRSCWFGGVEQGVELILGHGAGGDVVDDLGVGDGPVRGLEQGGGRPERVDDLANVSELPDPSKRLDDGRLVRGIVDPAIGGAEHCDGPPAGLVREALLQLVEGVLRRGARHLDVVRRGFAERDRQRGDHRDPSSPCGDDPPRVGRGEPSQSVEPRVHRCTTPLGGPLLAMAG